MPEYQILTGDCLESLKQLPNDSIDAIVTDPPYGLSNIKQATVTEVLRGWLESGQANVKAKGFMGKTWDAFVPPPFVWSECLRVLKPGGHLLAFAGSRTVDLMGLSLRLAGFDLRDSIMCWIYATGFPKSLDISKATQDKQWQGWGTALKPSQEPILVCRKPVQGTIADNVCAFGTGGMNIDGCRVGSELLDARTSSSSSSLMANMRGSVSREVETPERVGRWPANTLLVHSDTCEESACVCGVSRDLPDQAKFFAQFYYAPKASRAEREIGCEGLEARKGSEAVDREEGSAGLTPRAGAGRSASTVRNHHPTVKPIEVMRWLVKLITPPNGVVLDPFCGSGSTLVAALREGFDCLGCELSEEYAKIAEARCLHELKRDC